MLRCRLHALDFDYAYHESVRVVGYGLDVDYGPCVDCGHGAGYFLGHDFDCDLSSDDLRSYKQKSTIVKYYTFLPWPMSRAS